MWVPQVKIDAITVTLIGIGVIPWLGPLFKSVELPGGVKVEFQELERAREKVEESGLVTKRTKLKPMQKHVYAFQSVTGHDPNLALAGLRIEIESRLKEMAKQRNIDASSMGAGPLTKRLETFGALTHQEAAAIRDLLPLLNQAAHGASVESEAFDWAMDFGPEILGALDDRLGEAVIPGLINAWKARDGAGVAEVGSQLSKAFVESPNAFLAAMHENPNEFRDWLEGLGSHTFTLYEANNELEGELYGAYYRRLKELMLDAANSCKQGEYANEALAIEAALQTIEVHRIW